MERAKGFEPAHESKEVTDAQVSDALLDILGSQIGSRLSGSDRRDLARLVASWSRLHPTVKSAILAMVSSADG
jgi:hypothetical protein